MINIRNSQVISFGDNQSVTVYQDFSDANTWYLVPVPVIATGENGVPVFSLVEYDQGNTIAGTCAFQAELHVDGAALAAVRDKLGADITIGQFDWTSVQARFHFATAAETGLVLMATPSMYGANRASFIIHLPDQNTVNDFKNAFGPDGSAGGTFMLEYQVTALTRLPPATVTVEFNSQTAYAYQQTTHVKRDTWGHVTSETTEISQQLQQSRAGTITIDPGDNVLDPETRKRLQAWGNATLANDVAAAVTQAQRLMDPNGASNFSMSDVASFRNVYCEGQVVDWVIAPRASIPAFGAAQWPSLYSKVSNRQFDLAVSVQDLARNGVESIEFAVTYPLGTGAVPPGNTVRFTPSGPGSWLLKAPGADKDGAFDGRFSYCYRVNYSDGSQPYQSGPVESSDTAIYLSANDLNVLQVEFDARNVPFRQDGSGAQQNLVSHLLVDFYFFNESDGLGLGNQQIQLDATTRTHVFKSRTHVPFDCPYQYRLTYVLVSGESWVIDWQQNSVAGKVDAGTARAPVIAVPDPFQDVHVFLFLKAPAGQSFDMVAINAQYDDDANNLHEQHAWQMQSSPMTPDTWSFAAPVNVNGQIISYRGMYVIDGQPTQLQPAHIPALTILVAPGHESFGVTVDPSQIDWKAGGYSQVTASLYLKDADGNRMTISDFPAFHAGNDGTRLWTFMHETGSAPRYFYTAKYYIEGQAKPEEIPETEVAGDTMLVLPARGAAAR